MSLTKPNLSRLPAGLLLGAALLIAGCGNPEERGWNIPTDPQEKAAYDYAHSLKLPDSVPKPVPFNFALARIKALWPINPSVSDQYFEHLCKTEAGEYIVKTVENVEGVYQMRPRQKIDDTDLDFDRYALEEPTGIGWSGDDDNYNNYHSAEYFIQPMAGVYQFLEQPKRGDASRVFRLVRGRNDDPPPGKRNGYQTGRGGHYFSVPWLAVMEDDTQRRARYGFTWRGVKRVRDREFAIGSGEYIVVDLDTNEVLAVWRQFKQSGHDKRTSDGIAWSNAKSCPGKAWTHQQFVMSVLHWKRGINDEYVPEALKQFREGEHK